MEWWLSHAADQDARKLADRHYSRRKPGSAQFSPPGRKLILKTSPTDAYWVTSFPFAKYVKHTWAGAMVCSAFRNEGKYLSSDLIRQALAATRWKYPDLPELGMVTFVDQEKVRAGNPGYCFQCAGFRRVGHTKAGLVALQIEPDGFPDPESPMIPAVGTNTEHQQFELFDGNRGEGHE